MWEVIHRSSLGRKKEIIKFKYVVKSLTGPQPEFGKVLLNLKALSLEGGITYLIRSTEKGREVIILEKLRKKECI